MKGKKVLIVPLNWGLGHATRIIPIIKILKDWDVEVTISGSPAQISILSGEFNNIRIVPLPHFKIKLGTTYQQIFFYLIQLPKFFLQIRIERKALQELLNHEHFDLIISDNCYGLWNKKVKSVLITHQLNIKVPGCISLLQPLFNFANHRLIRNFAHCWVPDFKDTHKNLSGSLSHPSPKSLNVAYIGILSRFSLNDLLEIEKDEKSIKNILFILSGPEKQRTNFEEILKKQARELDGKYNCTFIRGLPDHHSINLPENWFNHVSSVEMQSMILQSDIVVCRSGYSSIMDLFSLQKPAILIPTPGQPEQEYLAKYLDAKGFFCFQKQKNMNIQKGIDVIGKLQHSPKSAFNFTNNELLRKELQRILSDDK